MKFLALAVIFILLPNYSKGSHIVFIHQFASYSHIVSSMPLGEALAQRGHKITYISAVDFPISNKNITFVVPERLKHFMVASIDQNLDISNRLEGKMPNWIQLAHELNLEVCKVLIDNTEFQNWMNSEPSVDLIFIDNFLGPECAAAIAYKLNSKFAIFNTVGNNPELLDSLGLAAESSSIPTLAWFLKLPMNFFERVINTLGPLGMRFNKLYHWTGIEEVIKQHLNITELPSMDELHQSISLVLMNSHFMGEYRRALPPMFVNIPGLHVRDSHKPLSKDILEFINSKTEDSLTSEGFVYISFGTVVKAPKLPANTLQIFFNSIKFFPNIRFIWRWDGEFPRNKPKNLLLTKWVDQQDLLGHDKIRGFVTQTGRPSYQEAVYNAVPLITFPVMGDQDYNADIVESMQVSVNLEIKNITEEGLREAFSKIIYDKKMKERCIEVSKLYKDLPMKPIETAIWWTEYILRHKNADHLKPLAINQTWYQRRGLDVWAFLTICVFICVYLVFCVCRFVLLKFIFSKGLSSSKPKQQ